MLALLGSFFAYAELQAVRPRHSNPAHEVRPYKEESRERFLSQTEIVRLGDALKRAERDGLPAAPNRRRIRKTGVTAKHRPKTADQPIPANPFAIATIRFLLLTGWREREALNLKWSEIDLARGTGASSGGSLLIIGKLLGHRESATTAKYAHLFDDPIRAAADTAAGQLAAWLAGSSMAVAPLSDPLKHKLKRSRR